MAFKAYDLMIAVSPPDPDPCSEFTLGGPPYPAFSEIPPAPNTPTAQTHPVRQPPLEGRPIVAMPVKAPWPRSSCSAAKPCDVRNRRKLEAQASR
jgi:hypothetical protein